MSNTDKIMHLEQTIFDASQISRIDILDTITEYNKSNLQISMNIMYILITFSCIFVLLLGIGLFFSWKKMYKQNTPIACADISLNSGTTITNGDKA